MKTFRIGDRVIGELSGATGTVVGVRTGTLVDVNKIEDTDKNKALLNVRWDGETETEWTPAADVSAAE